MRNTKIEWADMTWNPTLGCTRVSQGCKHCYAEIFARRQGYDFSKVRMLPERLEQPLEWKKPKRVFVNSMSDLFHERIPFSFIDQVFARMFLAGQHQFLILTKRARRMRDYFWRVEQGAMNITEELVRARVNLHPSVGLHPKDTPEGWEWPLPNVCLGVSVETQKMADSRITWLLKTPAMVRFLSCEPLLEEIDLSVIRDIQETGVGKAIKALYPLEDIDWVIVGGESGPGARPMDSDWARSIRDQCQEAGVAFFFKQWGEWAAEYPQGLSMANREMSVLNGKTVYRVGKGNAGRLLDGREWNEYPDELPVG